MTSGGWAGPALWSSLARHAIPVVGVLYLGWLPLDVLVFLLLETWLFLTLRSGVEAALNRSFGPVPRTLVGTLGQMTVLIALCGAAFTLVLGLIAVVVRQFAFRPAEWSQFVEAAVWTTPAFRVALALLLLDQLWDAGRFAMRIAPLPAPEQADDLQLQRMVLRVVFLAAAAFAAGLAPGAAGGRAVVIALAVAMVMLEAWPEEPGPESPRQAVLANAADGEAAAPRRSRRRRARSRRG